jgi:endonuclease-8
MIDANPPTIGGMPEGDTLFRTARVLGRILVGGTLTTARAQPGPLVRRVPDLSPMVGAKVLGLESRGKHLLVRVEDGGRRLTLRTHLRMTGSWHRYRVGERWRLPERRATVVLATESAVAVCFDCPTVELLTDVGVARSPALATLGPDLLAPSFETDAAVARLRMDPARLVGEALLDQRLLAGIGNVVRNEALFMERVSPWRGVGELDESLLRRLVLTSRSILQRGAAGSRVTTGDLRPGNRLWVYRRAGRPCRRCGTLIRVVRQGDLARLTYWCPSCQAGGNEAVTTGPPHSRNSGR